MPLAFKSLSHGEIAFGFFNIESDMLLLNNYFMFSTDFCSYISKAAAESRSTIEQEWIIYSIADQSDIGDLMGAIHGIHFSGFIGEVYKLFPFPDAPEDFKQKPEGIKTRSLIEDIVTKYGQETGIMFKIDPANETIGIGEYQFDTANFHALIKYVWEGGMPRWKDNDPPDYVRNMKCIIHSSSNAMFQGIRF